MIGTKLAHYEITSHLGTGGMGEVYQATDTKLGRSVAIKLLPAAFASDPDRLSRFRREAQVLASLNHPNIAHIYGLEESGDTRCIVMELIEGETLQERIKKGPISVDEALTIAKQIVEALEAAHEKGVVHRDLKPGNVMLTADGRVKVLDFGLAKAYDTNPLSAISSNSPTMASTAATNAGVILGTAAYMSPEQARGKTVDKRADIWAFGVVLYEMVTGRALFRAEDVNATLAAVMMKEPDLTAVPERVRRVLARCLEKDPNKRLRDISGVELLLEEVPSPVAAAKLPWAVAALFAVVSLAIGVAWWAPWRKASPLALTRVSVDLGVNASIPAVNPSASLALSADGSLLAFTAVKDGIPQLYLWRRGQLQSTPVDGSTGARDPFFSPDHQWIAFFADGKLKKVPVTGSGAAIVLCDAGADRGGTWTEDHEIVFQSAGAGPLSRVSDNGGQPTPLTTLAEGEYTERYRQMLPGGKAVLYSAHSMGTGFEKANVVVRPLPNGPPKIIQRGGYFGRYLASGHLVYIHNNTLFAATFDVARMELTGSPVPVLENVAGNPTSVTPGAAAFAVSQSGTAVYLPTQEAFGAAPVEWLDRKGMVTPLRTVPAFWGSPRFSPDGHQIAMGIRDGKSQDLWVYEWARDTLTRLTSDGSHYAVWSNDGRRITFRSSPSSDGAFNLYWKRADGSGSAQRLTESNNAQFPSSWHPSGRFLAFFEINPQTGYDLMILPMEGDETTGWRPGKPTPFLNTPATESVPMFSPDGRWIAYASNESGRTEVYVRPFPGPGDKWQISTQGGNNPVWSRAKNELLFTTVDNHLMVVSYTVAVDSFHAEKPKPWADKTDQRIEFRGFDLHPDGERLALSLAPPSEATQSHVIFIFNFFDELRRLAPAGTTPR